MRTQLLRSAGLFALAALALLFVPANSQACSCWGTTDIGTALTRSDIVVVGQVVRRLEAGEVLDDASPDGYVVATSYPHPIEVKVVKVLKGSADEKIQISTDFMCYRSFNVEDLKIGETYVFPIYYEGNGGLHMLPSCSHSALKLVDRQLYTNELKEGGGRRLDPYMSLALLQVLLPLGVLDVRGQIVVAASMTLLVSMFVARRARRRNAVSTAVDQPVDPMASLRSLRWRSGFAVGWMLLCAGICIVVGINEWDWIPWALGIMFAFAAAGIALRWPWSEGLSYGLLTITIGICVVLTFTVLAWYLPPYDRFPLRDRIDTTLIWFVSADVACVIGTIWCARSVRRRFEPGGT